MEIRLIRRLVLLALESSCRVSGKLSIQASECWMCNQRRCIREQPRAAPLTMITAGMQLNWWLTWVNSPKATAWQTSVKFSPLFSVTSEDFLHSVLKFLCFCWSRRPKLRHGVSAAQPCAFIWNFLLGGSPGESEPRSSTTVLSPFILFTLFYGPEPLVLQPLPRHEESLWLFPLHRVQNNERLHEFTSRTQPKKLKTDLRRFKLKFKKTECTFQNLGSSSFLQIFFSQLVPLLWVPFFPLLPPSPPLFLWFCLSSRSLDSRLPSDFSNFLTCSLISSFHVVTPTRGKETEGQAFPWLAAMFWLVTIQQAQSHRRNMEKEIGVDSGLHLPQVCRLLASFQHIIAP